MLLLAACISLSAASAAPLNEQGSSASGKKHAKKKADSESSTGKSDESSSKKKSSKVDVNSASKEELDALPGVGESYAQKIIDGRPYNSKRDLVQKGVLPSSEYNKIKDQITAHRTGQPESAPGRESKGGAAEPGSPVQPSPSHSRSASGGEQANGNAAETSSDSSTESVQTPSQPGMVWVNLDSGVYHRETSRWYGKTKHGKFMSEGDAQKAGYRAAKNERNNSQ